MIKAVLPYTNLNFELPKGKVLLWLQIITGVQWGAVKTGQYLKNCP